MNLSCVIIDDEPNAIGLLDILIKEHTEWQVAAKCPNAFQALAYLGENRPDFIFLDINMPQLSGMELAELLPPDTKIVFSTAYAEHAVNSYKFETIDYLLKPVTVKRFLSCRQKIELYFNTHEKNRTAVFGDASDFLFIKSGKTLKKISMATILYFEAESEYVRLVTREEQFLIYRRLKEVEEKLPAPFIRVHNSFIVNLRELSKIQDNHVFIGNIQIPITEKFREKFMTAVKQRTF
jgi:two-component system LytT family response regulator